MKKLFLKNIKRGFTLIEMLIVIVIIGILAAALIPRLSSARGRANDVARKADLQQTAAGIVSSQIDKGSYPTASACSTHGCPLTSISGDLISAGMNSLPEDPQTNKVFDGMNTTITDGQFGYTTITKGGIPDNGFVLMAGTETEGGSNRVVGGSIVDIVASTDYSDIHLCKTFVAGSPANDNNGTCHYLKDQDQLRYIYLY